MIKVQIGTKDPFIDKSSRFQLKMTNKATDYRLKMTKMANDKKYIDQCESIIGEKVLYLRHITKISNE